MIVLLSKIPFQEEEMRKVRGYPLGSDGATDA